MNNVLYLASTFILIFITALFKLLFYSTTNLTLKVYFRELAFPVIVCWAIYILSSDFIESLIKNMLKIDKLDKEYRQVGLPILTGAFLPEWLAKIMTPRKIQEDKGNEKN